MSTNKVKKVKMATKSCPECDQQIPVACKSCPCGYVFISRKLLNAKLNERSPVMDQLDAKRRRTERIRKEKINLTPTSDMENRRRPHSNSQSDPIRRGRGRPKTVGLKKQEEEKGNVNVGIQGDLIAVIFSFAFTVMSNNVNLIWNQHISLNV
uniref:Chromosome 16 open reading frame 87 n=1 Tax=Sinocyclocheilus grahami TaxID=75366 RepID=A0A672S3V0_SINGR